MKSMSKKQLISYVKTFFKNHNMLVLCTSKDNIPRATPMDFYTHDLDIYCYPGSGVKLINLRDNPVVSIGMYAPFINGKVRGLQISSSKIQFIKSEDPEFNVAKKTYRWPNKEVYLKITPEKIEILDFDLQKKNLNVRQVLVL